jgi:hypothetical protein
MHFFRLHGKNLKADVRFNCGMQALLNGSGCDVYLA